MSTFREALTQLASLNVTGVRHNYDVDSLPDTLSSAQLPALLVMPIDTQDESLFKERGGGLQTVAFSGAGQTVHYTVTHLLLLASTGARLGIRSHLPELITLIDNYIGALAGDVTLNATLLQPAQMTVETGIFSIGGQAFYGCAFRHAWVLAVS